MSAYVVLIRDRLRDEAAMQAYGAKARAARDGHAIKPIAFYGKVRTLEGDAVDGAVILEFPSFAEAEAWYESPLYQEARDERLKGGDYRAFIIDGVA